MIDIVKLIQENEVKKLETIIQSGEISPNHVLESGTPLLIEASFFGKIDIVEMLIKNGADIKIKDNQGGTAMMRAALKNRLEIMKLLKKYGGDVNDFAEDDNTTPLIIAAYNRHVEATEWLIYEGADMNAVDIEGFSLLKVLETYKQTKLLDAIEICKNRFTPENLKKYNQLRMSLLFE